MAKIIDSAGKGASLNQSEHDSNFSTFAGKNQSITATTHTIDVDDQSETIEYSNASPIAVTLPTIASVSGSNIHTDDFTVTMKNVGAGAVTITCGGTDTFDDGSTTIVLSQYEYVTIQTDSSLTKWNIINHDIDNATKTGAEELTNKELTSPVINGASFSGTQTGFVGNVVGDVTGNADTVTTNANLTGVINSIGNATLYTDDSILNAALKSPGAGTTGSLKRILSQSDAALTSITAYPVVSKYRDDGNATILIGTVLVSGSLRVTYDQKSDGTETSYVRVVKNGVAQGETTTTSAVIVAKWIDVSVAVGDILTLQHHSTGGATSQVNNLIVKSSTVNLAIA